MRINRNIFTVGIMTAGVLGAGLALAAPASAVTATPQYRASRSVCVTEGGSVNGTPGFATQVLIHGTGDAFYTLHRKGEKTTTNDQFGGIYDDVWQTISYDKLAGKIGQKAEFLLTINNGVKPFKKSFTTTVRDCTYVQPTVDIMTEKVGKKMNVAIKMVNPTLTGHFFDLRVETDGSNSEYVNWHYLTAPTVPNRVWVAGHSAKTLKLTNQYAGTYGVTMVSDHTVAGDIDEDYDY